MTELNLPWLELCVLIPFLGALWVSRLREPKTTRIHALVFSILTFAVATGTWIDFIQSRASVAEDRYHLTKMLFGRELWQIDEISAPLLPLAALLFSLTTIATVRTKARRFSFQWTLLSEALLLATFCCNQTEPWLLITLLALGSLPTYFELLGRGRATTMFVAYQGIFVVLMVVGWSVVEAEGRQEKVHTLMAIIPLLTAVLIRTGIVPFHGWVPDLFEKSSFGSALLFVTPLVGVYAAARLVLPIAPDWVMRSMAVLSIVTAIYGGGLALVQTEGRRLFSFLYISHAAVILVGLEMVTVQGLTGALCVWISVALSLTGFGLVLRAVEARRGRVQLDSYHGLYEHMPMLAISFLLTGLASVGFPGTMGYVGGELLVDGAVQTFRLAGLAIVIAAALSGIAVVRAYFLVFTGTRHVTSVSLKMGRREKIAILTLITILLAGGIFPHMNIAARHHAAVQLLEHRGPGPGMDSQPPSKEPTHP
jgi:NADH-quinone oxidoreductase subunit M